jgi:bifunctional DNase/RNase
VLPTSGGCAVILVNAQKVFVIYTDHHVGLAISMARRLEPKERPQTHDLIGSVAREDCVALEDRQTGGAGEGR